MLSQSTMATSSSWSPSPSSSSSSLSSLSPPLMAVLGFGVFATVSQEQGLVIHKLSGGGNGFGRVWTEERVALDRRLTEAPEGGKAAVGVPVRCTPPPSRATMALSSLGSYLAFAPKGGRQVTLVTTSTATSTATLPLADASLVSLAFAPDPTSSALALACSDGSIRVVRPHVCSTTLALNVSVAAIVDTGHQPAPSMLFWAPSHPALACYSELVAAEHAAAIGGEQRAPEPHFPFGTKRVHVLGAVYGARLMLWSLTAAGADELVRTRRAFDEPIPLPLAPAAVAPGSIHTYPESPGHLSFSLRVFGENGRLASLLVDLSPCVVAHRMHPSIRACASASHDVRSGDRYPMPLPLYDPTAFPVNLPGCGDHVLCEASSFVHAGQALAAVSPTPHNLSCPITGDRVQLVALARSRPLGVTLWRSAKPGLVANMLAPESNSIGLEFVTSVPVSALAWLPASASDDPSTARFVGLGLDGGLVSGAVCRAFAVPAATVSVTLSVLVPAPLEPPVPGPPLVFAALTPQSMDGAVVVACGSPHGTHLLELAFGSDGEAVVEGTGYEAWPSPTQSVGVPHSALASSCATSACPAPVYELAALGEAAEEKGGECEPLSTIKLWRVEREGAALRLEGVELSAPLVVDGSATAVEPSPDGLRLALLGRGPRWPCVWEGISQPGRFVQEGMVELAEVETEVRAARWWPAAVSGALPALAIAGDGGMAVVKAAASGGVVRGFKVVAELAGGSWWRAAGGATARGLAMAEDGEVFVAMGGGSVLAGRVDAATLLAAPSLPDYHPDVLHARVCGGEFERVDEVLEHVLALAGDPAGQQRLMRSVSDLVAGSGESSGSHVAAQAAAVASESDSESGSDDFALPGLMGSRMPAAFGADRSGSAAFAPVLAPTMVVEDEPSLYERVEAELMQVALPGLSPLDQLKLTALVSALGKAEGYARSLDNAGRQYLLALRRFRFLAASTGGRSAERASQVSAADALWATASQCQEPLVEHVLSEGTPVVWRHVASAGFGWWVGSRSLLERGVEAVAKAEFIVGKDPSQAALFYLALGKSGVLMELYKNAKGGDEAHNMAMAKFMQRDFGMAKHAKAASKNAYALMGKQRFAAGPPPASLQWIRGSTAWPQAVAALLAQPPLSFQPSAGPAAQPSQLRAWTGLMFTYLASERPELAAAAAGCALALAEASGAGADVLTGGGKLGVSEVASRVAVAALGGLLADWVTEWMASSGHREVDEARVAELANAMTAVSGVEAFDGALERARLLARVHGSVVKRSPDEKLTTACLVVRDLVVALEVCTRDGPAAVAGAHVARAMDECLRLGEDLTGEGEAEHVWAFVLHALEVVGRSIAVCCALEVGALAAAADLVHTPLPALGGGSSGDVADSVGAGGRCLAAVAVGGGGAAAVDGGPREVLRMLLAAAHADDMASGVTSAIRGAAGLKVSEASLSTVLGLKKLESRAVHIVGEWARRVTERGLAERDRFELGAESYVDGHGGSEVGLGKYLGSVAALHFSDQDERQAWVRMMQMPGSDGVVWRALGLGTSGGLGGGAGERLVAGAPETGPKAVVGLAMIESAGAVLVARAGSVEVVQMEEAAAGARGTADKSLVSSPFSAHAMYGRPRAATVSVASPLAGAVSSVSCVGVSPCSRYVVVCDKDGGVGVWQLGRGLEAGQLQTPVASGARGVVAVSFSPSGAKFATLDESGLLSVYRVVVQMAVSASSAVRVAPVVKLCTRVRAHERMDGTGSGGLAFLGSETVVATTGPDSRASIKFWDLLLDMESGPASQVCVMGAVDGVPPEAASPRRKTRDVSGGGTCMVYSGAAHMLIVGTRKGQLVSVRGRERLEKDLVRAHPSSSVSGSEARVTALGLDESGELAVAGLGSGGLVVRRVRSLEVVAVLDGVHTRSRALFKAAAVRSVVVLGHGVNQRSV
ncbi:uncharacterized protein AMSG_12179 [Thecamonas trahens ATCC 50062]|uniref:RAVE complex protein Rav1 C-terminal domain-containing protein n=1 Tax=Thecamonas trahens ATCC 50062 TaxID=461836 RepID=A0A0L0DK73_THETB|nr:hypothetical protein AMSG_12179 [Thecamonas trahens ATCC 50062]KNC52682.1 hypothetical protein AMSG_12179 [Thecamonas trahens ATCC 50062]|eukprot:XP_013755255.1 hypothetical protein AMSG_12179 [Thecamonas trahens ATCC 50062]